jgi:hypothetical protein
VDGIVGSARPTLAQVTRILDSVGLRYVDLGVGSSEWVWRLASPRTRTA